MEYKTDLLLGYDLSNAASCSKPPLPFRRPRTPSHSDEPLSLSEGIDNKIILGVVALEKKVNSKPMRALLNHLEFTGKYSIIKFPDSVILEEPIETWPKVECLISFFSSGFPYEKVLEYVKLVKPFEINDLEKQAWLFDRRTVYRILKKYDIRTSKFLIYERETDNGESFEENKDYLKIHGEFIRKPFVEKPFDADDHNIYIYYGEEGDYGCTRLMRKTETNCSEYLKCEEVRKDKGYIYEPFLKTDGYDIKVYAVGPSYFHAEARRSPVLDTKVQRNADGKEVRYPILLTAEEKEFARKVVKAYGQFVCGFDILRSNSGSFVCDVNGWSFVKGSAKFYADSALIMDNYISMNLRPGLMNFPISPMKPFVNINSSKFSEPVLKAIAGIFRHGDRTPKKKLKFLTDEPLLCVLCKSHESETRLTTKGELMTLRKIIHKLLSSDSGKQNYRYYQEISEVLHKLDISEHAVKAQFKIRAVEKGSVTQALMVFKWGGCATKLGLDLAEKLGTELRESMYPGQDTGFVRLHATYVHDLKCFSAEEQRCLKSAASFLKGYLQLENDLTPIVVTMVHSESQHRKVLDLPKHSVLEISQIKTSLKNALSSNEPFIQALKDGGVELPDSITSKYSDLQSCNTVLEQIYNMITDLVANLNITDLGDIEEDSIHLLKQRWELIKLKFKKEDGYDIFQLNSIRDYTTYDLLHYADIMPSITYPLCQITTRLGNLIENLEYGYTLSQKKSVSSRISKVLLDKLKKQFYYAVNPIVDEEHTHSDERVFARYYFANLSDAISLMHVFQWGQKMGYIDSNIPEDLLTLELMGHFIIKLYEDPSLDSEDANRHYIELTFNPGMKYEMSEGYLQESKVFRYSWQQFHAFLDRISQPDS